MRCGVSRGTLLNHMSFEFTRLVGAVCCSQCKLCKGKVKWERKEGKKRKPEWEWVNEWMNWVERGVSGSSFLFQNSSSSCFDWKFNFVGLLLTWNNFDLWSFNFCEHGESISSVGEANLFLSSEIWWGDGFLNIDLCKLLAPTLLENCVSCCFFWCKGWNCSVVDIIKDVVLMVLVLTFRVVLWWVLVLSSPVYIQWTSNKSTTFPPKCSMWYVQCVNSMP